MSDAGIYKKLQAVQSMLKVNKTQFNKFGDYYYRSCEDILEAAKPILAEQSALLIIGDELVLIGERYYIKATARFIDCESGTELSNTAYAREALSKPKMDDSQVTGSASSYARKYALNGLLCLDDVKDADTQDNRSSSSSKKSASTSSEKNAAQSNASAGNKKVSEAMIRSVQALVDKHSSKGLKMEKVLGMYKIKSIADMDITQYKDCMNKLKLYEKE